MPPNPKPERLAKPDPRTVLVAMSGGVDSSVAAWLLLQQRFRVAGATLRLVPPRSRTHPHATDDPFEASVRQAGRVCEHLGIPHHVLDYRILFEEVVIDPFCKEYAAGRTPNPCVVCNPRIKWTRMLRDARDMGFDAIATGHYARIAPTADRWSILRGLAPRKDQSYALYRLSQEALAHTLLPLGALTKSQTRQLADRAGLPTGNLPESQDICFVPRGDLRGFLARRIPQKPGDVLDLEGRRLGSHRGLAFYTVGQRRGLGIATGTPLYVVDKDRSRNALCVGPRSALRKTTFWTDRVNWVSTTQPPPGTSLHVEVEVRYRSQPIPACLKVLDDGAVRVLLGAHNQSIAPGQSAVWYRGETLIGGGVIRP